MRGSLPGLLLAAGLVFVASCKKKEGTSAGGPEIRDAAVAVAQPIVIEDSELGLRFDLPPTWLPSSPVQDESRIVDARRRVPAGRSFLVAPRFVVSRIPSQADLDTELSRVLTDLKALGEKPNVTVLQTLTGFRQAGSLELREATVHYRVGPEAKGQELIQKTFVGKHTGYSGQQYTVEITATALVDDQELLGTEVDHMLSGFSFAGTEVAAPPGLDPGGRAEPENGPIP